MHEAREADPDLEPDRTRRERILMKEIKRVWDENRKVYGARKVWKVLKNKKTSMSPGALPKRLMHSMELKRRHSEVKVPGPTCSTTERQ